MNNHQPVNSNHDNDNDMNCNIQEDERKKEEGEEEREFFKNIEERIRIAKQKEEKANKEYEDAVLRIQEAEQRLIAATERLQDALFNLTVVNLSSQIRTMQLISPSDINSSTSPSDIISTPSSTSSIYNIESNNEGGMFNDISSGSSGGNIGSRLIIGSGNTQHQGITRKDMKPYYRHIKGGGSDENDDDDGSDISMTCVSSSSSPRSKSRNMIIYKKPPNHRQIHLRQTNDLFKHFSF